MSRLHNWLRRFTGGEGEQTINSLELVLAGTVAKTVEALQQAIKQRDAYTYGHCMRVSRITEAIARELQLPPATVESFRAAASLHDLGMIGIRNGVLLKASKLTEAEYECAKQHTTRGWQLVQGLVWLDIIGIVVRYHHERWDGRGYPDGFGGEVIPLAARIVAVAEVYDSLTSTQVWRPRWTTAEARNYLFENAGSQFDPAVVTAFLSLEPTQLATDSASLHEQQAE